MLQMRLCLTDHMQQSAFDLSDLVMRKVQMKQLMTQAPSQLAHPHISDPIG